MDLNQRSSRPHVIFSRHPIAAQKSAGVQQWADHLPPQVTKANISNPNLHAKEWDPNEHPGRRAPHPFDVIDAIRDAIALVAGTGHPVDVDGEVQIVDKGLGSCLGTRVVGPGQGYGHGARQTVQANFGAGPTGRQHCPVDHLTPMSCISVSETR
jgi:hypothetical protein